MKKLIAILTILCLLSTVSSAFGQITLGEKPEQTIEVTIDENGTAHVVHSVKGKTTTQQVDAYEGKMENLSVKYSDDSDVQYLTLEKYPLGIVLPPTKRDLVIISYDLVEVVVQKEKIWTWDYTGKEITKISFPDGIDRIWINDRPIFIGDKSIRQHGGAMKLEYIIDEPTFIKKVTWENRNFDVAIKSLTDVENFEFSQPAKSLTFNVDTEKPLVTIIIPLELLWEPYDVYVKENQTLNSEFHNNGTHVWLGFRPDSGNITITGASVVPEFPFIAPLILAVSLGLVFQFRDRLKFN